MAELHPHAPALEYEHLRALDLWHVPQDTAAALAARPGPLLTKAAA